MKTKTICLILITLTIAIGVGFYSWSVWKKQMFYSREQKCFEKCWLNFKDNKDFSPTIKMEGCKIICSNLPRYYLNKPDK